MIMWPPVLVIQNTGLGRDDAGKTTGLGNAEVREVVDNLVKGLPCKVQAKYGPSGHLGISTVVFNDSRDGYIQAWRLDRAFEECGRGRSGWLSRSRCSSDKLLYGYFVEPSDHHILRMINKPDKKKRCPFSVQSLEEKVDIATLKELQDAEETRAKRARIDSRNAELEMSLQSQLEGNSKLEKDFAAVDLETKQHLERMQEKRARAEQEQRELVERFKDERIALLNKQHEQVERARIQLHDKSKQAREELQQLEQSTKALESEVVHRARLEREYQAELRGQNLEKVIEKKLAEVDARFKQMETDLRKRQEEEREKLLNTISRNKYATLSEFKHRQDELQNESSAEKEVEQTCIVCLEPFGPERGRMVYMSCHHATVCNLCIVGLEKECPYCRAVQTKPPIQVYGV